MFFIDFTNTSLKREQIARDVISWFDKTFLSDYVYGITIEHCEMDVFALLNVSGELEEPREFHIDMNPEQTESEYIKSLIHEMIHIEDYMNGNLTEVNCNRFWKGVLYEHENYEDQPWEIRAHSLEDEYYRMYRTTKSRICQVPR